MNLDPTENMPEPERTEIRKRVIAQADAPPPDATVLGTMTRPFTRVHSGADVAEVWAHGPVLHYRYGGAHPSGLNRHERRKAAALARR